MSERYKHRAFVIRRFLVTSCNQGSGAPMIDRCWGGGESRRDGRDWLREPRLLAPECAFEYSGFAILLTPWRRDERVGFRKPLRALVVGWITSREPISAARQLVVG